MAKLAKHLIDWAAGELGCEPAVVQAVADVESSGSGMVAPGKAVVRFEGATFHNLTDGKFDQSHPTLSMSSWQENSKYVKGGLEEWSRIEAAAKLDHDAAYKSASYGMFQIMGFNYKTAGYSSVDKFVADMNAGDDGQFRAFIRFVIGSHLKKAMQDKDWRGFARHYNGPGQVDHYAAALERDYRLHAGGNGGGRGSSAAGDGGEPGSRLLRHGSHGADVKALQETLSALGFNLGPADGVFGDKTTEAVRKFQASRGLTADGIVGHDTWAKLKEAGLKDAGGG
jgi:hypothetical protein